jgi:hypothetical protein
VSIVINQKQGGNALLLQLTAACRLTPAACFQST